jgi:hypothetical protein
MRLYDPPCRMSASAIWALQRASYQEAGPHAWGPSGVPLQVVANPWIADAYARVVLAHLRALADAPGDDPVYLIELGAGSGRFAHYLLQALARHTGPGLRARPYRLVITDLAASNVAAWRRHPQLSAWFASGVLEAAVFDLAAPGPLTLADGTVLGPGALALPPIFLANYVFDSLPADGFWTGDGERQELLLGLATEVPRDQTVTLPDTAWLRVRAPAERPSYPEPAFERLLDELEGQVDQTSYVVPIGVLRCLDALRTWGPGWVLLATDKGDVSPATIHDRDHLTLVNHDTAFSTLVNFYLIGRWIEGLGGAWHTGRGEQLLVSTLAAVDLPDGHRNELHRAYERALCDVSALDYQRLVHGLADAQDKLSAGAVLSSLRQSCYDPFLFTHLRPVLMRELHQLVRLPQHDVRDALLAVWERRFALPDAPDDLAFAVATVLHGASQFEPAVRLYEASLAELGPSLAAHYNLALALESLARPEQALSHALAAAELGPQVPELRHLVARLQAT